MAISKSFLLLALAFAVVLLIVSVASARDLLAHETDQTMESLNAAKVDGYYKGHGHGHHDYGHWGHGHYGHHEHHGHGKKNYGHHEHYGHGKENHGHHRHGKGYHGHWGHEHHGHGKGHGGYSYHSVAVGTDTGN